MLPDFRPFHSSLSLYSRIIRFGTLRFWASPFSTQTNRTISQPGPEPCLTCLASCSRGSLCSLLAICDVRPECKPCDLSNSIYAPDRDDKFLDLQVTMNSRPVKDGQRLPSGAMVWPADDRHPPAARCSIPDSATGL